MESKLAVERSAREKAETLLEEAKQAAQRPSPAATNRPLEQYEKKITDLQNELEQVRQYFFFIYLCVGCVCLYLCLWLLVCMCVGGGGWKGYEETVPDIV